MNEMKKRICLALISVAEAGLNLDPERIVHDSYGNPEHPAWQDYEEDAHAVLLVMSEPTELMLEAPQRFHPEFGVVESKAGYKQPTFADFYRMAMQLALQ